MLSIHFMKGSEVMKTAGQAKSCNHFLHNTMTYTLCFCRIDSCAENQEFKYLLKSNVISFIKPRETPNLKVKIKKFNSFFFIFPFKKYDCKCIRYPNCSGNCLFTRLTAHSQWDVVLSLHWGRVQGVACNLIGYPI